MTLSPLDLLCTSAQKHIKQLYRSIIFLYKIRKDRMRRVQKTKEFPTQIHRARRWQNLAMVKGSEAINKEVIQFARGIRSWNCVYRDGPARRCMLWARELWVWILFYYTQLWGLLLPDLLSLYLSCKMEMNKYPLPRVAVRIKEESV